MLEALRAGRRQPRKLYLLREAKGLEGVREAARGVPIQEASRTELDALAGGVVHQGVVLEAESLPVFRAESWVRRGPRGRWACCSAGTGRRRCRRLR